jgi:hypothetical protein
MKIAAVYIAVTNGPHTTDHCAQFVASINDYPGLVQVDFWIACNGGPLTTEQILILSPLNPYYMPRVNDQGYDLSAYQDAVRGPCALYDAVLCLGESIRAVRMGWLQRLVSVWQRLGPGFYGFFGSNNVSPHMQTSAFFTSPDILRSYPIKIQTRAQRYEFEHGSRAMWRLMLQKGRPVRCITWDGEWLPHQWRQPPDILWRGNQGNLLFWNNHAMGWLTADPTTRLRWAAMADRPYQ